MFLHEFTRAVLSFQLFPAVTRDDLNSLRLSLSCRLSTYILPEGMMKFLAFAVMFAAILGFGHDVSAETIFFSSIKAPDKLAGFNKIGQKDFESRTPGLGYSVKYVSRRGVNRGFSDVYFYDLGLNSIPDGPQSSLSQQNFARSAADVHTAHPEAKEGQQFALPRDGEPRFQCTQFQMVDAAVGAADSYLCVSAAHGKFVKVRLSCKRDPGCLKRAEDFVMAWVPILWP